MGDVSFRVQLPDEHCDSRNWEDEDSDGELNETVKPGSLCKTPLTGKKSKKDSCQRQAFFQKGISDIQDTITGIQGSLLDSLENKIKESAINALQKNVEDFVSKQMEKVVNRF
jgi:hypothetical protein